MMRAEGRRRRYSFAEHGNSTAGGSTGNYLMKSSADVEVLRPAWGGGGFTTIRPLPVPNETGDGFEPFRVSAEPKKYGDWIRSYPAVRKFGNPGVTFIIGDPAEAGMDVRMTPAHVLWKSISDAKRAKQDQPGWAALLDGGDNRGAELPRPSEVFLVQCLVMHDRREVLNPPRGFSHDHKVVVMELSPSLGRTLLDLLDIPSNNPQAEPGNWDQLFQYGDPISLDGGRFFTFYKAQDGDPRTQQAGAFQNPAQRAAAGNVTGWGVTIDPDFQGSPPRLAEHSEFIFNKVRDWDDILRFPTIEEQAAMLADKFPADVLLYGWRDHQDWIPETVRNRAVARTQFQPPQGGWSQGQPGMPTQVSDGGLTPPQLSQPIATTGFGAPPLQQASQPPMQQPNPGGPPPAPQMQPAPVAAPPLTQPAPFGAPVPTAPQPQPAPVDTAASVAPPAGMAPPPGTTPDVGVVPPVQTAPVNAMGQSASGFNVPPPAQTQVQPVAPPMAQTPPAVQPMQPPTVAPTGPPPVTQLSNRAANALAAAQGAVDNPPPSPQ